MKKILSKISSDIIEEEICDIDMEIHILYNKCEECEGNCNNCSVMKEIEDKNWYIETLENELKERKSS